MTEVMKKKDYGVLMQSTRQQIEASLDNLFRIMRSSHHGGDFKGHHCCRLARFAEEAAEEIKSSENLPPNNTVRSARVGSTMFPFSTSAMLHEHIWRQSTT